MSRLELLNEMDSRGYRELLFSVLPLTLEFGLIRETTGSPPTPSTRRVEDGLRPFHKRSERVNGWPGSRLPEGSFARREIYSANSSSVEVLLANSVSLFDWTGPRLPGDLHFLSPSGVAILGSIASEREAWLELSDRELKKWWTEAGPHLARLFRLDPNFPGTVAPLGPFGTVDGDSTHYRDNLMSLRDKLGNQYTDDVASYLGAGTTVVRQFQKTVDVIEGRFECPGGSDLKSDGRYFWRADAAQYVRNYRIALPTEALAEFEMRHWVPETLGDAEIDAIENFLWTRYRDSN